MTKLRFSVAAALLVCIPALAHVGTSDVYFEGAAGPYRLLVTVQPPDAVPGIATVTARAATADAERMTMVPLPARGDGAKYSPTPDVATRDPADAQTFTASLWLMSAGAWQVRIHVDGAKGEGTLSVPVPSLPARTKNMQGALGILLAALVGLLAFGAVSIAGAASRDGQLAPGVVASAVENRRSRRAMVIALVAVVAALAGGNAWWNSEADDYARYVYKPLDLQPRVDGGKLALQLADPGWLRSRRVDDLVPDHGHLMHLFVVAMPDMQRVWHLHPTETGPGAFSLALPDMPAGKYRLYGDVVHATGLAETATAELSLPQISGAPLTGDDAAGEGPAFDPARNESPLAGGGKMVWLRDGDLVQKRPSWFRFRIDDADGKPTTTLEPYMGMMGHAAFVRRDGGVFAHVHPTGSVPMASLMQLEGGMDEAAMMKLHETPSAPPPVVAFPFGLPSPGDYRLFVQVKRAGKIETGVFDARVK
jgi:hypothetical protein